MKVVILAGGLGTRISEETDSKPKPMVGIGRNPILWHIMKIYSAHGINEFIICCGYKGYVIKDYFANYFLHNSDVTFFVKENRMDVHHECEDPWTVTLIDTGENTMTGGRIKRVEEYIKDEENFCLTYGDGVGNIDITKLIAYHEQQRTLATLTAVFPPGRFGALVLEGQAVTGFAEKPQGDGGFINGGFFVLDPDCLGLVADDATKWEEEPMRLLAERDQLRAFKHEGFWQPMDTLRDRTYLEELWATGNAPWRVW